MQIPPLSTYFSEETMSFSRKAFFVVPLALALMAMVAEDTMAQRGGRGRGGGRGPGGGGPGGGPGGRTGGGGIQSLLMRKDVQKELDLTEEQVKDLESLSENRRGGRDGGRDLRSELEGLSEEERRDKFREMREEREKETEGKLKEILLGGQFTRLKELSIQYSSQQRGGRSVLSRTLIEALDISDEQLEDLEKRAEELEEELNKEVAKLRAEMKAKLMKELTPKQQSEYKKLAGDTFEFEQQSRQRPQQRGTQRPGRGGQQGRQGNQRQKGGRGARPEGDDADF